MPPVRSLQQWPRGPRNELHKAARFGSAERTLALLASGAFDVNQGDPEGVTPLMLASLEGYSHIVKILLDNGADVSIVASDSGTALNVAAQNGHAAVVKILVDAGANIEGQTSDGCTPLHVAAYEGHPEVMRVLIEAGANPNSRIADGSTPMYSAAFKGHTEAVRILIRAKASPRFVVTSPSGNRFVPLDMAAQYGHSGVVRELLREHGIRGCAGETGGIRALRGAAQEQHVGVMAMLAEAGVADAGGQALVVAAEFGCEASVKFLIGLQEKRREADRVAYVSDTLDPFGRTPVLSSIDVSPERSCSPRIVRMLIDAGAATSAVARITNMLGQVEFNDTPLGITERILRERKIYGRDATAKQLHKLEAVRRLLLRVAAVRAASWLWPRDRSGVLALAGGKGIRQGVSGKRLEGRPERRESFSTSCYPPTVGPVGEGYIEGATTAVATKRCRPLGLSGRRSRLFLWWRGKWPPGCPYLAQRSVPGCSSAVARFFSSVLGLCAPVSGSR